MMGPRNFRTLAMNEPSTQTAPQRTPALRSGRQGAQYTSAPAQGLLSVTRPIGHAPEP
jgi:hypothetical protein